MRNALLAALLALPCPAFGCRTALDCSLNGECTRGACECAIPWEGAACDRLMVLPTNRTSGYYGVENGRSMSSWGGPVLPGEDGLWHMFASEMMGHCGINAWTTNSHIIHATSTSPTGQYTKQQVLFGPFAHEPSVSRAPTGEWVMWFTASLDDPPKPCNCINPAGGCDSPGPKTMPTWMSWAPSPHGPWSTPAQIKFSNPQCDTNFAALIHANSSVLGLWRDCNMWPNGTHYPGNDIHTMTATHWKDTDSYVEQDHMTMLNASSKIPADGHNPWLAEDPCIYRDKNGHYHTLTHHMWHCGTWAEGGEQGDADAAAKGGVGVGMGGTCGGHGYSADGLVWYYSGVTSNDVDGTAYGGPVKFTDGGSDTYSRRERPQMVLSNDGTPVAITTSVMLRGQGSHTQAVPLRTSR